MFEQGKAEVARGAKQAYNQLSAVDPPAPPSIGVLLDDQANLLARAWNTLGELEKRLDPVLAPVPATPGGAIAGEKRPPSKMVDVLREHNGSLDALVMSIDSLLSRTQL